MDYLVKSFNFSMWCGLYPPTSLFMACKEKYNSCMNRASLDRESLDRVLWSNTTPSSRVIVIEKSTLCIMRRSYKRDFEIEDKRKFLQQ